MVFKKKIIAGNLKHQNVIYHSKQILESEECLKICTGVNSTDEKYFMDFIAYILHSLLFLCYTTALAK